MTGVIDNTLNLVASGLKIYWTGGIDSDSIHDLKDFYWFSRGR